MAEFEVTNLNNASFTLYSAEFIRNCVPETFGNMVDSSWSNKPVSAFTQNLLVKESEIPDSVVLVGQRTATYFADTNAASSFTLYTTEFIRDCTPNTFGDIGFGYMSIKPVSFFTASLNLDSGSEGNLEKEAVIVIPPNIIIQ